MASSGFDELATSNPVEETVYLSYLKVIRIEKQSLVTENRKLGRLVPHDFANHRSIPQTDRICLGGDVHLFRNDLRSSAKEVMLLTSLSSHGLRLLREDAMWRVPRHEPRHHI